MLNYFFFFRCSCQLAREVLTSERNSNMAPQQQNSTFIDDNLDSCPSLLNLPESPILPTRRCQNQDTNNNNNNNNKRAAFEEPAPNLVAAPPRACKNKHGRENGNAGQASRRHRSISLYGVNSTVVSATLHLASSPATTQTSHPVCLTIATLHAAPSLHFGCGGFSAEIKQII